MCRSTRTTMPFNKSLQVNLGKTNYLFDKSFLNCFIIFYKIKFYLKI